MNVVFYKLKLCLYLVHFQTSFDIEKFEIKKKERKKERKGRLSIGLYPELTTSNPVHR